MDEMREALSDAFDEAEETNEEEKTNEQNNEEEGSPAEEGNEETSAAASSESPESDNEEQGKLEEEKQEEEKEPVSHETKAPQSWSPAEREEWAKLPANVQAQVLKRETEISQTLTESAEARKQAQSFNQMIDQYQGMFASQGVDPMKGTNDILQTAAMLQGGAPQQKAQVIAHLINSFGVDVKTLDGVLAGKSQEATSSPEYQNLHQQLQQQQQFINQMQQQQQQSAQAQKAQTDSEVEQFIKTNEFAGDLRLQMADFMDMAEKYGQPIDLKTAYERALTTRPDIQQILESRKSAQSNQQAIEKARQASASLPQSSGTEEAPKPPGSMREAIALAMEQ